MKRLHRAARRLSGCLLVLVLGCQQQLMIEPADRERAISNGLNLHQDLENRPHDPIAPSEIEKSGPPATVLDPSRPPRPMTLKECIAIAFEQGNVGSRFGPQNAGGGVSDAYLSWFGPRQISGVDNIKAFALDPAIIGNDIEKALSKFDARWITSMVWNYQDQAVLNLQQSFSNGDSASFNTTFAKPLPTGGVAGISFNMNYQSLSDPPLNQNFVTLATSYTPRLQFIFEQPLLQNYGVEINQLLPNHAGSALLAGLRPSGGSRFGNGILVARIHYDQSKAEFDKAVNDLLLNVEFAYWNLYAAYFNLYGQEDTLAAAANLFFVMQQRLTAGTVRPAQYYQVEGQYWQFRQQVLAARQQVLNAERALRSLLGLNSFSDGQRIVPVDEPILAPYMPDYFEMANSALGRRPDLMQARMELKIRQLDLVLAKNQRRPDLRFFSAYDINGLGARLDGSPELTQELNGFERTIPNNALASLRSNQFNSWQLGLRLDMPLGFRDANADVRERRLQIYRSYIQLQEAERRTLEQVTQQQRDIVFQQEFMKFADRRHVVLTETVELQNRLIEVGNWNLDDLFNILQTQRDRADAFARLGQSIAQYNQSLAGMEYVKGTIQEYNSLTVAEGPLPPRALKKAADHFSARQAAWKLREREFPTEPNGMQVQPNGEGALPFDIPPPPGGMTPRLVPADEPPTPAPAPKGPLTLEGVPTTTTVQPWPENGTPAVESNFTPMGTLKFPRRGIRGAIRD